MDAQHASYLQFRRKLIVGYLVLCALLVSLLAWKFASDFRADRAAAAAVTENSARALVAHVEEIVDVIDQPLRLAAARIKRLNGKAVTAQSVAPLLAAASRGLDSPFWLLFIDASGRGVAASNNMPVSGVAFAERAYFRAPAAVKGEGLYVGGPAIERSANRRVFYISRRVESASGTFLGVVVAPVDASRVAKVFERARLGPAMSITLTTSDNIVIARAPLFEASFGADLSSLAPQANAHAPTTFEAGSPINGDRRLYSYAPFPSLPLNMTVGVTQASWMAGFRSDLFAGLVGLSAALIVAFYSIRFALDRYRRLVQVEARQRKLIDQLAATRDDLARSERRLRVIADSVPGRVAYINADERYTFHNAGEHGAPLGALMGKTVLESHGADIYALLKDDIHKALLGERISVEHRYERNGKVRYFRHQYAPDVGESGTVHGFYAMVTDITDFKTIQHRLSAAARIDTLTGLPNRAELMNHLDGALARCRRTGHALACLYLDIDKFKEVNDVHGHAGGDCALIEFGRRLRQCVRESDLVARLAGDEFVIALESLDHPSEAAGVAAKIIASMGTPFNIEGTHRLVTTSIGMVIARPLQDDARALLRAADDALYRAKRAGRNRVELEAAENDAAGRPDA